MKLFGKNGLLKQNMQLLQNLHERLVIVAKFQL